VIFGFLKRRRRHRLRAVCFPDDWLATIKRNVAFFHRLSARDQAELLGHVQVFLSEKRFEGCDGFEITDEVRVTIAAQACLLLLHRKTDYFQRLLTILVYPSTYLAEERRHLHGHVWQEGKMARLGETGRWLDALILAWDAVKSGAAHPSDGKNVVLHEFAHQLDYENQAEDGAPALETRDQQLSWQEVMRIEFASLRTADETGIPTLLDTYGASLSDLALCEPVIRNCTPSYKSIFSRIRSNILLKLGHPAGEARRIDVTARYAAYCGCGTIRIYGFGAFQPCG
jgi:Mlc titration factor MtfA (ptsG expression regulator)